MRKTIATTLEDGKAMLENLPKGRCDSDDRFPHAFQSAGHGSQEQDGCGDFGKVFCFNSTNQGELPKKYRDWFVDKKLAGGGAIIDLHRAYGRYHALVSEERSGGGIRLRQPDLL
jgi:hypothetical protein